MTEYNYPTTHAGFHVASTPFQNKKVRGKEPVRIGTIEINALSTEQLVKMKKNPGDFPHHRVKGIKVPVYLTPSGSRFLAEHCVPGLIEEDKEIISDLLQIVQNEIRELQSGATYEGVHIIPNKYSNSPGDIGAKYAMGDYGRISGQFIRKAK